MAVYKIKDLELLTGIKAHTIRMWEKRYGILRPERTETQIRSYSDGELLLLLNVSLLNRHGIKISRIAEMSEKEIHDRAKALSSPDKQDSAIDQLIVALLQMDEAVFRSTIHELTNQYGIQKVYDSYLIPFLERIGVMWIVGTINPAQEHFISNLIRQRIIAEIDLLPIPESTEERILLYLPEHEWHELSLLFFYYHLRKLGKYTVYLGQALPYDSLLKSIEFVKPTHIISSWLTAVDGAYLQHYFEKLQKETDAKILVSGYQIKQNPEIIPPTIETFHNIEELTEKI
jgi:DNA-binding transcriptional MerR regulator